jgi:hypothetical protein
MKLFKIGFFAFLFSASFNVLAIKNEFFDLTEKVLVEVMQPCNFNLKAFWREVHSATDGYEAVKYNVKSYPNVIANYCDIIDTNMGYFIVDKLGLSYEKSRQMKGFIKTEEYDKLFSTKLDAISQETLSSWIKEAETQAITTIIRCLEITSVINIMGGTAVVDLQKADQIDANFGCECRNIMFNLNQRMANKK